MEKRIIGDSGIEVQWILPSDASGGSGGCFPITNATEDIET